MFLNTELQNHLETSSTVKLESLVIAEWNMNSADNIAQIGNYRFRPNDPSTSKYKNLVNTFSPTDEGNYYTDATDSDIVIDGGYLNDGTPTSFVSKKQKEGMLYSLEDCFGRFRPRSGINKLRFFPNKFTNHANINMALRPRYYMASKDDKFKYWTSYRTEKEYPLITINSASKTSTQVTYFTTQNMFVVGDVVSVSNTSPADYDTSSAEIVAITSTSFTVNKIVSTAYVSGGTAMATNRPATERGIANYASNNQFYISDAAPYVVYNKSIPANRVVVKMQTNVGSIDLGPFKNSSKEFNDPFYGRDNMTIPVKWKIQYLSNNNWVDAISFNQGSLRDNGLPIIGSDGYVEISYGFKIPELYKHNFVKAEEYSSANMLPTSSVPGYAYLVKKNSADIGTYHIWTGTSYNEFIPEYGWFLSNEEVTGNTSFVTDLTSPDSFISPVDGSTMYREFQYLSGLRVVAETMNKFDSTLDIIEISPRLTVDISSKTSEFKISKMASDIGASGMPVGQLLASNGTLSIFDYDQAFNANNKNSIIYGQNLRNLQFKFFETIKDVDGYDYSIPVKTMYSDGFPNLSATDRTLTIQLRDMFSYFESIMAPQIIIQNTSLSYAISVLLDSIGFSNYVFKRTAEDEKQELQIPYFYIPPDKSIIEILQDLAVSSQTAMFFDEYNNFVMMGRNYMMPTESERAIDMTLYGTQDFEESGQLKNKTTNSKIANIIDISSQNNNVYNDGKITYSTRYIQKTYGSIQQANKLDNERTWMYKPVKLWQATGEAAIKSTNDETNTQSSFGLAAIPLDVSISAEVPTVVSNKVINNIISVGEGIYRLSRYNGYFYANGEIIKYDAVEYNIPSITVTSDGTTESTNNVWLTNDQEYQNYFSKISFNGKIYPTGRIRIYSKPYYEEVDGVVRLKSGPVEKHGRGQFGTNIVAHSAELDPYWYDNANVRGCTMDSTYLFSNKNVPYTVEGAAGVNNTLAQKTTRNGVIRNFLGSSYTGEADTNTLHATVPKTVQSSALVMNGPTFTTTERGIDFVSYVYKPLTDKFKHFGTRMRILGKIDNSNTGQQTPIGSQIIYTTTGTTPDKKINLGGSGGGLAVMINPETNNGYYFELTALTETSVEAYTGDIPVFNMMFYKIKKDDVNKTNTKAIPIRLWGGLTSSIIVNSGSLQEQARASNTVNPSIYDLAIEYKDIGTFRRFFLYVNGKQVAVVDDQLPLKIYNNMALFTRGTSRVMFENIYALASNYSENTRSSVNTPVQSVFGDNQIDTNEALRSYAMSGMVQSTYLSGLSPQSPPEFSMYFDEFGTILREAAYMNVRYEAYPAIYSKLAPVLSGTKGYVVSGYIGGAYGAEFLVFNATDTTLDLSEKGTNYLIINGVSFTQSSQNELTVDEYFAEKSDFANPKYSGVNLVSSPLKADKEFRLIKNSRATYGKNEFTLDPMYVQTQDQAHDLMGWMISKIMKPRKSVGMSIFSMPTLQLGDLVSLQYSAEGVNQISDNSRFIVYNIEYLRNSQGPEMNVYLSEVI